jgi:uncharacterized membrane protein
MNKLLGRPVFAAGLIALGIASLVLRNILMWQRTPAGVLPPSLWTILATLSGVVLLITGLGLLSGRFRGPASRVLLVYLFLLCVLREGPPVFLSPGDELSWLEIGMFTVVLGAGWLLTGRPALRSIRVILGLALIPVGLSHFFYLQITTDLVPTWMPVRPFWAYLVGVAHIAAGLGLLFDVLPRLAAMLEAGMLLSFAILVWIPRVIASPAVQFNWTEMLGTWVIGAAMWVVADALAGMPWLSARRRTATP